MFRTLAIIASAAFVIAALCFSGAAALAGRELAKSDFWRDVDWGGTHFDLNAPIVTEARNLSGFTNINVSGGLNAEVMIGPDFEVEVIGPAPDAVLTEVNGTTLTIRPQRQSLWRSPANTRVRVSIPSLTGASSSAGADMDITGVTGGDISLDASAGAALHISGACATLNVETSSGARIDASSLVCARGIVEASSGGGAHVNVSGRLDVEASSGGHVDVAGHPQIGQVSLSSGGSLDRD